MNIIVAIVRKLFCRRNKKPVAQRFRHLEGGNRYRVAQAFWGFDGIEHPAGECWTFIRPSFLPYEDGVTLSVASPGGNERQIRLQSRPDAQGRIVDHLDDYIAIDHTGNSVRVTRDSVCLGDGVDAPHERQFSVPPDISARQLAKMILSSNYLPYVGRNATWTLAFGREHVVFGLRCGRRFILPVHSGTSAFEAPTANVVHLGCAAQKEPRAVTAGIPKGWYR